MNALMIDMENKLLLVDTVDTFYIKSWRVCLCFERRRQAKKIKGRNLWL